MRGVNHSTYLKHFAKSATKAKPKKKKFSSGNKHYPVQRHIRLAEGASPQSNNTTMLVRVDRELSRVNHRLYRQSRVPSCKITLDATVGDMGVDVYVLRDTWMNQKAYQLAKNMFDENSKEELEQLKTMKARWNDFRVNMGLTSFAELDAVIEGETTASKLFGVGEYELSEVADAAGTAKTFRWLGTGANTFNIIDEYDATGNNSSSPAFPAGTNVAYDGLTDELDDSQMDHLSSDGNAPPYSLTGINNDVLVRVARLVNTAAGASGKLSTGFFNAPCGFIVLEGIGGGTSVTLDSAITLEVQAGDYKGVKAPSYLE